MTDPAAGTQSTPTPPANSADPSATAPATSTTPPAAAATPAATAPAPTAPVAPAYKLPEDLQFAPEAVSALDSFVKTKAVDGKLTTQDLADALVDQYKSANQRWEAQIQQQNSAWEAQSRQRFTPAQRALAEAGVGFLTSRQMALAEAAKVSDETPFRELAKGFMNHPGFVQAMVVLGELLNEDRFEPGGSNAPVKKSLAATLYPNANPS